MHRWASVLKEAERRSIAAAEAASRPAIGCRVWINRELVGVFKGMNCQNLDWCIRDAMAAAEIRGNCPGMEEPRARADAAASL